MFSISIFSTPLKIQFTPSLTFLQRDGKQKSTRKGEEESEYFEAVFHRENYEELFNNYLI
jgi:hypothetical protein